MKTLQRLVLSLLSGILIAGCSAPTPPATPTPEVVVVTTTPKIVVITNAPTSTSEPQPTATASQSPTSTSTLTPTATPANCPEYLVVDSIKKAIPSGIFRIPGKYYFLPPIYWDLETGQKTTFDTLYTDIDVYRYVISPDRKRIALAEKGIGQTIKRIWIVTLSETVQTQFDVPPGWSEISWINDHLIGIGKETGEWDGVMLTYDLQTGTSSRLVPPFRDLYQGGLPFFWRISYSPDLRWVTYINNDNLASVVVNLENNQIILKSGGDNRTFDPLWTRSGDKLVIYDYSADGLYIISRDGQITLFPIPETIQTNPKDYIYTSDFALSPDDRYLAAWIHTKIKGDEIEKLLILDMKTNQVLDFCVTADDPWQMLWSPDSTGLIIPFSNFLPDETRSYRRVYLDLTAKTVIEFPKDPTFYEWFSSEAEDIDR